ncbi:helix-turn-helix domain-containing protein [Exiguobacterium indicum]|uniref:helix-turn-helix domain-containing protein n=1 Tax=Exiguobacterium indicum TaxID=296995 RepID=UPI003982D2FE
MKYVHLTTSERVKIETYLELGVLMRKIAQHLERQPSTILRELKQNPSYNAINAGRRCEMQKKNCGACTLFSASPYPFETARDMVSRTDRRMALLRTGTIVKYNLSMDI